MPIKIAFWNCTLGAGSSDDKKTTFIAWRESVAPDLLILEEASFTVTAAGAIADAGPLFTGGVGAVAAVAPMDILRFVNTLDVNDNPTTKQLVVLVRHGNPLNIVTSATRFPGLEAKRLTIKASRGNIAATAAAPAQPGFELYGMHANASAAGGAAATAAAKTLLTAAGSGRVIVGGDFNCAMETVDYARKAASLRFDHTAAAPHALTFTQWNRGGVSIDKAAQQAAFGFTGSNFINQTLKPNNMLDFVMVGADVPIVAERNCPNEALWLGIVRNFDHCPVVYSFT